MTSVCNSVLQFYHFYCFVLFYPDLVNQLKIGISVIKHILEQYNSKLYTINANVLFLIIAE